MEKCKQAYLLQVFNQPELLVRIIDRLDSADSFFYIHVDAKVRSSYMNEPQIVELQKHHNVFFTDSIDVQWGDVTEATSVILMLRNAIKNKEIDRFHYISGADYPIKTNQQFNEFFVNNPHDYIAWIPEESKTCYRLISHYFLAYGRNVKQRMGNSIKYYSLLTLQRLSALWADFLKLPLRKRLPMPFYHGLAWFSLKRSSVEYILDYLDKNPWFIKRFKYTANSVESIFIMLLLDNPEIRKTVINDGLRLLNPDGTLFRGGAALDDDDFDRIKNSPAFFARKFDSRISAGLLERIDREILNVCDR